MSKKGTYNGPFFSSFATRIRGTPIRFGVLIGTELDEDGQRDAVFAAVTPPQLGEDGTPVDAPKDVAALLKSKVGELPFVDWAAQHMEAVRKLLPGGLEPCGCFAVASESAAKDLAPLLVPLLKGIKEPLVLTVDPNAPKPAFWQHVGGAKPALRPAQVKADPHKEGLMLWAAWPFDLVLPCAGKEADPETLASEAEKAAAASLSACTAALAHSGDGMSMRAVNFADETAIATAVPKGCTELRVAFLRGGTALHALPNPEGRPTVRQRCLLVATTVVLNRKTELRRAVDSLRRSLATSAGSRLQLALEEAEGTGSTVQLPFRVLSRAADLELPVFFGDYCMPDEDLANARERLAQLLGVQESALLEPPGHLEERSRLSADFKGTYTSGAQEADDEKVATSSSGKSSSAVVFAVIAVLVALLAMVPMLLR